VGEGRKEGASWGGKGGEAEARCGRWFHCCGSGNALDGVLLSSGKTFLGA